MSDPFFFGYGSLVNRATHSYGDAHPATLRGWRRVWRHTPLRPVAYLTAEPAEGSEIEGLIAHVPGNDWAILDEREHAYDRAAVTDQIGHLLDRIMDIHVYSIPPEKHGVADRLHPVLLSYVDVVVQGYLREFGQDGVERFFATTAGWEAPVLDDRAAPIYSRALRLDDAERDLVDACLRNVGARGAELTKGAVVRDDARSLPRGAKDRAPDASSK